METPKEIWKPIPGYKNYEVSSLGRIRSLDRVIKIKNRFGTCYKQFKVGKILSIKKSVNNSGYIFRKLIGKGKTESDHRLVCMAFYGVPSKRMVVNHKNRIRTDNRVENLEWISVSQNVVYSRRFFNTKGKTRNIKFAFKIIREIHNGLSVSEFASKYKVSRQHVSNVLTGRCYPPNSYPELDDYRKKYPYYPPPHSARFFNTPS